MTTRPEGLRGDRGFSFVELLAYMAIAALLILAAIPQFGTYRGLARDAAVQDDVQTVAYAIEAWVIDNPGQEFPYVNQSWDAASPTMNQMAPISEGTRLVVRDRISQRPSAHFTRAGEAYCIFAYNPSGKRYLFATPYQYHSGNGGPGVACLSL